MAENLEKKVKNKEINLKRIALTSLGYGVVGSLFDVNSQFITAPVMASMGFGASLYDEVNKSNINLLRPAVGILVGGLLGSFISLDQSKIVSNICSYAGAVSGGALGFYKSYLKKDYNNYPKS